MCIKWIFIEQCGAGLARQLADKYEGLEEDYSNYCREYHNYYPNLCGSSHFYFTNDGKIIANIFSQKENFDTDYSAMKIALTEIKTYAEESNFSIAIPRNIGNGIANGINGMAEKIIREVFKDSLINVTMYEL